MDMLSSGKSLGVSPSTLVKIGSLWVTDIFLFFHHTESWSGHGNTAFHRSLRTCYARLLRRTHAAAALPMSFGLDLRIFVLLLHTSFLLWLTSHFYFIFCRRHHFISPAIILLTWLAQCLRVVMLLTNLGFNHKRTREESSWRHGRR